MICIAIEDIHPRSRSSISVEQSLLLETSGLGLFEHNEESVELSELFRPERIVNKRIFAFWMSGDFVVEYGEEEDQFGMKRMKVDRKQNISLDSGRVVKTEWSPSAFEE